MFGALKLVIANPDIRKSGCFVNSEIPDFPNFDLWIFGFYKFNFSEYKLMSLCDVIDNFHV
jgi:hypothetical protein